MKDYGGPLTVSEWRHWKLTGECVKGTIVGTSMHPQDSEYEEERYRTAVLSLAVQNPYYNTVFNAHDPIWIHGLKASDGICCYNDGHVIEGPCFPMISSDRAPPGTKTHVDPLQHGAEHEFTQQLLFCSPGCVIKEIHRTGGAHRTFRMAWFHDLIRKYWMGGQHPHIVPSPSRQLLTRFEGPMEIENWRSQSPRFRFLRTAPICHDFPKNARLDTDLYEISDDIVKWNWNQKTLPSLLDASVVGFNYLLFQDKMLHFPRIVHVINLKKHAKDSLGCYRDKSSASTPLCGLSMQLTTIEVEEEPASNQDNLNMIIEDSQPKHPNYDNIMLSSD
jgi:hypothetical protein